MRLRNPRATQERDDVKQWQADDIAVRAVDAPYETLRTALNRVSASFADPLATRDIRLDLT